MAYIAGGFSYLIAPYKDGSYSSVSLQCIGQLAQTWVSSTVAAHIEPVHRHECRRTG